jgi:hypothetical protein
MSAVLSVVVILGVSTVLRRSAIGRIPLLSVGRGTAVSGVGRLLAHWGIVALLLRRLAILALWGITTRLALGISIARLSAVLVIVLVCVGVGHDEWVRDRNE